MSPVFFVLVSLAITSIMLSVIFFLAWHTQGRKQHALTWSATFALAAVQWTVNLFNESFPTHDHYWLTANALMLITVSAGLLGHCQRVSVKAPTVWLAVPAFLTFCLITWFTIGEPHVGMRVGVGPVYAALTLLIATWLLLTHRDKPRPAEWGAAITMIMFSIIQFAAAIAAFSQGATAKPELMNIYFMLNFLGLPAAYTGMGMFVIFMLASDLSEQMKEIAIRDQLTSLLNRRGFNEASTNAYATARRTDRIISVVLTDIDLFKSINDRFGHNIGDQALCHFADILATDRRDEDILARIGGEEFALILPGANVEKAIQLADKLCRQLAASPLSIDGDELTMTASFGVASISINDTCLTDVVVRADSALYRAKRAGRNRIDLESSQLMMLPGGALQSVSA